MTISRRLTVSQAAEILGCYDRTVRNMIYDGRLKAEKLGRDYVIRECDLARVPVPDDGVWRPGRPRKEKRQ